MTQQSITSLAHIVTSMFTTPWSSDCHLFLLPVELFVCVDHYVKAPIESAKDMIEFDDTLEVPGDDMYDDDNANREQKTDYKDTRQVDDDDDDDKGDDDDNGKGSGLNAKVEATFDDDDDDDKNSAPKLMMAPRSSVSTGAADEPETVSGMGVFSYIGEFELILPANMP